MSFSDKLKAPLTLQTFVKIRRQRRNFEEYEFPSGRVFVTHLRKRWNRQGNGDQVVFPRLVHFFLSVIHHAMMIINERAFTVYIVRDRGSENSSCEFAEERFSRVFLPIWLLRFAAGFYCNGRAHGVFKPGGRIPGWNFYQGCCEPSAEHHESRL